MTADLALINGKIYTMNQHQPRVAAVAIEEEKILKLGTTQQISEVTSKDTEVIDLKGETAIPGFIDTHIHVLDFAKFLLWLDLAGTGSIAELQSRLKSRLENAAEGKWILGRGWNENCFAEKRLPTRFDLDVVSPDNPVILYYHCGLMCLVNSRALEAASITRNTRVPTGGTIEKDPATGEPTGILKETATNLVWKHVPEPGNQEILEATELALKKIVEAGISSIHWLATSKADLSLLERLCRKNKLPIRINMVIPPDQLKNAIKLKEPECVKVVAAEVYVDQFLASRTAALFEPYLGTPPTNGQLLFKPQELDKLAAEIVKEGYQVIVHAMGDRAIDAALTAMENLPPKCRQRIDSGALLNANLIRRLKAAGAVVSVQPLVAESEFCVYSAVDNLGNERARWLYPLKTLFDNGVPVCGGSDCPMEPLNPLLGIQSVVTRPFFPEERLSVENALRMYTVNGAYGSGEEHMKGSIIEGKLADITVLSSSPFEVAPERISEITVEMTIVNGKIIYDKKS